MGKQHGIPTRLTLHSRNELFRICRTKCKPWLWDDHLWPHVGSTYKSEIGDHLYANGAIDDEQKKVFSLPDFANIELTPGNHVIKVQAMGGRTSFDEIKVQAHSNPDTPTGIDLVQQLPGENFDANAPVEWYTLQGVRVENPSNGIFIRRQGSRAAKVALK